MLGNGLQYQIRIYIQQPFCHDLGLCPPHVGKHGMNLPVGITCLDLIHIHDDDFANASTHQQLSSPGANAANAHYKYLADLQLLQLIFAYKQAFSF